MKKEYEEIIKQITKTVKENFDRDGFCSPIACLLTGKGLGKMPWQSFEEIVTVVDKLNPELLVIISEAWMKIIKNQEEIDKVYEEHKSLEHVLDRDEIVFIISQTTDEIITTAWKINRTKKKPFLEDIKDMSEVDSFGGRFADILKNQKLRKHQGEWN